VRTEKNTAITERRKEFSLTLLAEGSCLSLYSPVHSCAELERKAVRVRRLFLTWQ